VGSPDVILLADTARHDIANYVSGLFTVYIVLLFIYILLNLMFSLGVRPPYSRVSDAILGFLRDISEPFLRIFRRFIPPLGQMDLSPILGIILLYFVRYLLVSLING
jgi:YggT family protein